MLNSTSGCGEADQGSDQSSDTLSAEESTAKAFGEWVKCGFNLYPGTKCLQIADLDGDGQLESYNYISDGCNRFKKTPDSGHQAKFYDTKQDRNGIWWCNEYRAYQNNVHNDSVVR